MGMIESFGTASAKTKDRVLDTLKAGLEIEFGRGAGQALARRFLEAEEADFHWDARIEERWIGTYQSAEETDFELDRIAICGWLDGTWFCATLLVDGDGNAHGMIACRTFRSLARARDAMCDVH